MTNEEVNRVIAEFVGLQVYMGKRGQHRIVTSVKFGRVNGSTVSSLYTESLDALVPVWEKMDCEFWVHVKRHGLKGYNISLIKKEGEVLGMDSGRQSIQQAAAHATAQAILESKDER